MSAIDEVKSRIDIVDVIGEYVTLQRSGRNFRANCPFHNERTPSFFVSPERQTWHCFGACATGGDVFNFVMRREGIEFGEALRMLALRAGVVLADRWEPQEDERRQRLLQASEAAAAYFHNALLHSQAGEAARSYLTSRGLDIETIEAFQLGYSPDSWDALKSHLAERAFGEEELVQSGLLVESDRGGYDRFRGRLMFPIHDERGRVVGFGARLLESAPASATGAPGAKYLNTPQTTLFDKSRVLYALHKAKDAIRRERSVIVVEGYMDAIAAHQHGQANVVASMGTALTERQIRMLERLKSKIMLAMDADAAGIEATLRALQEAGAAGAIRAVPASAHPAALDEDEFSERAQEWSRDALKRAAITIYVVPLSGKDPDEMIRVDRTAWDTAVAGAKPFTDHVFETVAGRKDLSQPGQRAELLQELLPVVRLIEEPVYRAHYVQRLARLAQVAEDVLRSELRKRPATMPRGDRGMTSEPVDAVRLRGEPGEEFCLALLLRSPELRAEGMDLSPELFLLEEHRAVFRAWREAPEVESIRQAIPQELHPQLARIMERDLPALERTQLHDALRDCVARIEFRRLSAAKQARAASLAEPELQEYMSAAVDEAFVLEKARTAGAQDRAPPFGSESATSELASRLMEDSEIGRRLHRSSSGPRSGQEREASPQGEGDT